MKIIHFPSDQRNSSAATADELEERSSLLFQYREDSRGELLVWSICVVCALASIVLCFRQVQNDLDHIQRVHLTQVSASRLANETSCQAVPRQL